MPPTVGSGLGWEQVSPRPGAAPSTEDPISVRVEAIIYRPNQKQAGRECWMSKPNILQITEGRSVGHAPPRGCF